MKREKIGLENVLSEIWGLKNALGGNKDRDRKRTIWDMKAQKHTQKEIGLENTLCEMWGHKDALKKEIVRKHTI